MTTQHICFDCASKKGKVLDTKQGHLNIVKNKCYKCKTSKPGTSEQNFVYSQELPKAS